MTLQQRLEALVGAIGNDIKSVNGKIGNLSNLSTTAKTNLVAAINEVLTIATNATGVISDTSVAGTLNKTWSVDKIITEIAAVKQSLLGGVPATAFDTLKEIADYIQGDQTATSGLITSVANKVDFSQVQNLTTAQKQQARSNISAYGADEIGNYDVDLVALYNSSKA